MFWNSNYTFMWSFVSTWYCSWTFEWCSCFSSRRSNLCLTFALIYQNLKGFIFLILVSDTFPIFCTIKNLVNDMIQFSPVLCFLINIIPIKFSTYIHPSIHPSTHSIYLPIPLFISLSPSLSLFHHLSLTILIFLIISFISTRFSLQ